MKHTHTHTHTHTREDSYGQGSGLSLRPMPADTQYSQKRDIHVPGGFRTHNPSKSAALDPRLSLRGHRDRHIRYLKLSIRVYGADSFLEADT